MTVPYPTLQFGLSEEAEMIRDTVHRFAQDEIDATAKTENKDIRHNI